MTQPQATSQREAPKLRRARPEDVKAIAHLGAATFSATFGYSMPASDLQAYLQEAYSLSTVAHQLASPLIDVVVAVDEADQVIGFVQLTQGTSDPCVADLERPVELQRLYVDVNHHGGGVGRALVTEVEKLAKASRLSGLASGRTTSRHRRRINDLGSQRWESMILRWENAFKGTG